ncbi:hypothetical protein SDC9_169845 [bioreactor metagenome]|uniref:Uncharacterized protein n=1 Tax=bioreactor metagenome TaxID=1076179 RepID=A0A645G906_9ZZZZ
MELLQLRMQITAGIWLINDQRNLILIQINFIDCREYIQHFIANFHLRTEVLFQDSLKFLFSVLISVTVNKGVHLGNHILCVLEIQPATIVLFHIPAKSLQFFQAGFDLVNICIRRTQITEYFRFGESE